VNPLLSPTDVQTIDFVRHPDEDRSKEEPAMIELRILAEVSADPAFVQRFRRCDDLHRLTAATMYGVSMEEVSKEQRSDAERINFGLRYGRGAMSLSAQLGTEEERGRQLIDEYFASYPKVQRFLQRTANRATSDRTLRTIAGRLRKRDEFVVECAEGVAPEVSERTKRAMIRAEEDILEQVPVEVEVVIAREWQK